MSFIDWKVEYETGIEEIDNDHRKLFGILNDFYKLLLEGKAQSASMELFDEMVNYAQYHFKKEESFLANVNYPLLEEHIEQHRTFEAKLLDIKSNLISGVIEVSPTELLSILTDWLLTHIMGTDMLYVPYLK
jgi:hemerythrin-like metal-binding protein